MKMPRVLPSISVATSVDEVAALSDRLYLTDSIHHARAHMAAAVTVEIVMAEARDEGRSPTRYDRSVAERVAIRAASVALVIAAQPTL